MKIAIYNSSLKTIGGGEKYIGVIAWHLAKQHDVTFITGSHVDKELIEQKLNLDLQNVHINSIENFHEDLLPEIAKDYDFFINCTYMSGVRAPIENSAIIIFFPSFIRHDLPLWLTKVLATFTKFISKVFRFDVLQHRNKFIAAFFHRYTKLNHIVTSLNYIKTYKLIISISKYSKFWTKKELEVDSQILYPPVDTDQFIPGEKENIILSVGRFFKNDHNKKQLEMIRTFKKMFDQNKETLKDYKYYLCGGVSLDDPEATGYLEECKKIAAGYPIEIKENIEYSKLKDLYSKAKIFWHATGFNEDVKKDPDKFEHFGITTVEAMSAGVVPVVINKAGQIEVMTHGKSGYLWNSEDECINYSLKLVNDDKLRKEFSKEATIECRKFSRENMVLEIDRIFSPYLDNL